MKSVFLTPAVALALVGGALLAALPVQANDADIYTLQSPAPEKLGTRISGDNHGAIRIDTVWPTTINLAEVDLGKNALQDTVLKYTAQMKTEGLEGSAFLEMWVHFPGPKGGSYFSRGLDNQLTNQKDWKDFGTPFFLKKDQTPDKATLNLVINGKGSVWVKDVKLQH